jgi:hypothetical protein
MVVLGVFGYSQVMAMYVAVYPVAVWRQAQLTDAIRPSSAAVVENYYVVHLARLLPCAMKSCAPSAYAARP